jgi:hypothetical protein
MATLELLFLMKFSTTLLKTFKLVKPDHSRGQNLVNNIWKGNLVILVNMNIAPLLNLNVIKVL